MRESSMVEHAVAGATAITVSVGTARGNVWLAPVVLSGMMVFFQIMQMALCYSSQSRADREVYDWERPIKKKVFTWGLWTCCFGMDVFRMVGAVVVEQSKDRDLPFMGGDGFLWFTCAFATAVTVMEWFRIGHAVAKYQGRDTDAWAFEKLLRWVAIKRGMDEARWRSAGHEGPPPARFDDEWTIEDYKRALEQAEARLPPPTNGEALR